MRTASVHSTSPVSARTSSQASSSSLYLPTTFIRSDKGREFIAHPLKRWCKSSCATTAYIEPRSAWQTGFAESYKRRSTASTTDGSGTNA